MEKNSFIRFGISEKCYIHICIKDLEGELSYRVIIHNIEYDIVSPMFIDYVKEFVFSYLPSLYKNDTKEYRENYVKGINWLRDNYKRSVIVWKIKLLTLVE